MPSPRVGLFTDQDEILFAAARPVILNGIEDIITRPDLADRAIPLMLAPIAERQRRPEHALWQEFEHARPHILGALLDAAAHGLHMLPRVRLQRLPRMADFALWATACESAFRPAGTLETAYSNNRRDAIENIVDADPWRPVCARPWRTERNGPEAHPTFCRPAPRFPAIPWFGTERVFETAWRSDSSTTWIGAAVVAPPAFAEC